MVAPLPNLTNPTGPFKNDRFTYLEEAQKVVCPGGQESYRKTHITASKGTQYVFPKEKCAVCPLREKCTMGESGRTVFISDYWKLIQAAKEYNQTEEGKASLRAWYDIERTNNEMNGTMG